MQKLSMLALRDLFWIFFCFALNFDVFESDMRRVFLALYSTYQVRIFTNKMASRTRVIISQMEKFLDCLIVNTGILSLSKAMRLNC